MAVVLKVEECVCFIVPLLQVSSCIQCRKRLGAMEEHEEVVVEEEEKEEQAMEREFAWISLMFFFPCVCTPNPNFD